MILSSHKTNFNNQKVIVAQLVKIYRAVGTSGELTEILIRTRQRSLPHLHILFLETVYFILATKTKFTHVTFPGFPPKILYMFLIYDMRALCANLTRCLVTIIPFSKEYAI
jgi:hypothetical protein